METIDQVLVAMRRVLRATALHSKHLSKTVGLTMPQLLLLQAIAGGQDVTVGELARRISLSQATVTTILDRLQKRGLLYRQRSTSDKRKIHPCLTAEGRRVLETAPTPLQEQFIRQFRGLEPWEQSMILAALQRVAQMMDAQDIDASPFLDLGELDRTAKRSRDSAPEPLAG
jgi:DNA-binding MarR family transcriptional regulator